MFGETHTDSLKTGVTEVNIINILNNIYISKDIFTMTITGFGMT